MSKKNFLFAFTGVIVLLGAGCSSPTTEPAATPETQTVQPQEKSPEPLPPANPPNSTTPVTFTDLGVSSDHFFNYQLKINDTKTMTQVDMKEHCVDSSGQAVGDLPFAWQNIQNGLAQPIQSGKTYKDHFPILPGSTKCTGRLDVVHYADGTTWSAEG